MTERYSFNSENFWGNYGLTQDYIDRNNLINNIIDENVSSLLDIGCGKGIVIDELSRRRPEIKPIASDSSFVSHKYVTSPFTLSSLPNLPFANKQFDLVLCLQVLEHLNECDFRKSIEEIQRLAKKHLVIGVPNNEILDQTQVLCSDCGRVSNANGHLRSFSKKDMEFLFPKFICTGLYLIGMIQKKGSHLGILLQHNFANNYYCPESFLCPYCGGSVPKRNQSNWMIQFFTNAMNSILRATSQKSPYWMICYYERKTADNAE